MRCLVLGFVLCQWLVASVGLAGNWSSGGGQLIKDAHNPWFLQNTSQVSYCILHDPAHFQLNQNEGFPLEWIVRKALAYWQDEAAQAYNPGGDFTDGVKIATQQFVQSSCDTDTDIKFQFGTLTQDQRQEMDLHGLDPREYVSLAVRTDYDEVNLRGKGFIYLAADSGPLKPNTSDMIDFPWAEGSGGLIYQVLVHELGHVFGIQHQSQLLGFMRADFPEEVLKKNDRAYSFYNEPFFSFRPYNSFSGSICIDLWWQPVAVSFFGIPSGWDCYETRFSKDGMTVWARPTSGAAPVKIGEAAFGTDDAADFDLPVSVWLPEAQQVYPPNPARYGNMLFGPMIRHSHRKGLYVSEDGSIQRPISASMSPNVQWNRLGGIMNGEHYINIQGNF